MGSSSANEVHNPVTPTAFLTPDMATQTAIGIYFHVGWLAVLIWDILQNVRNDYRLITRHRIGLPTFAYFISRTFILAYALGRAVILTVPVDDCRKWEHVIYSFCTISLTFTSLLFYIRVCAVFNHARYIVVFFGISWLAVVGMACTVPTIVTAVHIGPTKFCIEQFVQAHQLAPPAITLLISDTLVFLATSYRFYRLYAEDNTTIQNGLRIFFFGASMPAFSRALLHESQLYYMIVLITKLVFVIAMLILRSKENAPLVAHLVATHVIMVNTIACRVFRNTKLGIVAEPMTRGTLPLTTTQTMPIQFSERKTHPLGGEASQSFDDGQISTTGPLVIGTDKNVISVVDYANPHDDNIQRHSISFQSG